VIKADVLPSINSGVIAAGVAPGRKAPLSIYLLPRSGGFEQIGKLNRYEEK
jgi:hypothetical protein